MGNEGIFLPCFLDVAMTSLPYFYFGYILKRTPLLFPNNFDKYNIIFVFIGYIITYAVTIFFKEPHMSFHYNKMYGNIFVNYIGSFTCVIAVLLLCKMLKHLPIVSYCGRYSIILLCLHHMIYRPVTLGLRVSGIEDVYIPYISAIITVALCIVMIPFCIKYIPMFIAQKDLIKYSPKNKVCLG